MTTYVNGRIGTSDDTTATTTMAMTAVTTAVTMTAMMMGEGLFVVSCQSCGGSRRNNGRSIDQRNDHLTIHRLIDRSSIDHAFDPSFVRLVNRSIDRSSNSIVFRDDSDDANDDDDDVATSRISKTLDLHNNDK